MINWLTPVGVAEDAPVFLDFHGGALVMCGGDIGWMMSAAAAVDRPGVTWVPDYRMPPDHPFPAALDDAMAAYRAALQGRDPQAIIVGGTSAGGNIAAALLLRARDAGLPMPAATLLLTPEVDLTESGDSFQTLAGVDVSATLMPVNELYAAGHDLADPYLSPLFGDLAGFPPTYLAAGTRDFFLSNTVRMHRALLAAGVSAELHIFEAMPHGASAASRPRMPTGGSRREPSRGVISRHAEAGYAGAAADRGRVPDRGGPGPGPRGPARWPPLHAHARSARMREAGLNGGRLAPGRRRSAAGRGRSEPDFDGGGRDGRPGDRLAGRTRHRTDV